MVEQDDEHDRAAALAQALRDAPEVEIAAVRATVLLVLQAHFGELDEGRRAWPSITPAEALSCLRAGEAATMEHVDAVTRRVFALVDGRVVIQ